jgi:hypothetical protein
MASLPQTSLDFDAALNRLCDGSDTLAPRPAWLQAIQDLGTSLGAEAGAQARFCRSWRTLYTATLLLDHLQDGDYLGDPWLVSLPPPLQYHLAFSAYAVAQQQLADLVHQTSLERLVRLQTLWASTVRQLAIGQFRDLTQQVAQSGHAEAEALDQYESIASQKTGAAFALALGGSAILATEDLARIDAATNAGLLFGMLLQYSDDLLDTEAQASQPATITLARALAATSDVPADLPLGAYWQLIYAHYSTALQRMLTPLPQPAQNAVWNLLHTTFGEPPKLPQNAAVDISLATRQ